MLCDLCPRGCKVDREIVSGFCNSPEHVRVARAALHFWEEPCISGESGSGTIFFSGCTMRCVFCQNKEISTGEAGLVVSDERLVEIMFELAESGANNINMVTPDHYAYKINRAVKKAKEKGLAIPIVMNTGGYLGEKSYALLSEVADIWLTDYKYFSPLLALSYSSAPEYPVIAAKMLHKMVEDTGEPKYDGDLLKKGVIVRILLLPGCVSDAQKIVEYVYKTYGEKVILSLMNQYTPPSEPIERFPELNRKVTKEEYDKLVDYAISLGVEEAYIQEDGTAEESFIPAFDYTGVLPKRER